MYVNIINTIIMIPLKKFEINLVLRVLWQNQLFAPFYLRVKYTLTKFFLSVSSGIKVIIISFLKEQY